MGAEMSVFRAAALKSHQVRRRNLAAAFGEPIAKVKARWKHRQWVMKEFERRPSTIAELRAMVEASGMRPRRIPMGVMAAASIESSADILWQR